MGNNIDKTLAQRGAVYGDYKGGSEFRAEVMKLATNRYKAVNGKEMEEVDRVYIYDIINKLSRLTTTPNHIDTWHDIVGYAKLVEEVHTKEFNDKLAKDTDNE